MTAPHDAELVDESTPSYPHLLRLTPSRWELIAPAPPTKAVAVVIGAWLVFAWGRFGFQGIDAPRVMVRFILVGVYGWLLLASVSLLGLVVMRRVLQRSDSGGDEEIIIDPVRVLQVTGLCHQPLLILGIAIQIGQAIPIPFVLPVLTVVTFGLWFPGQVLAAARTASSAVASSAVATTATGSTELSSPRATAAGTLRLVAPVAAVAYLAWVATAGRHLFSQLGHLI